MLCCRMILRGEEVAWEVLVGHQGAVDATIVAGKEEVHVLAVADRSLVDGAGARACDGSAIKRLSLRMLASVGVADTSMDG